MHSTDVRRFDLNIEKILEGWEIRHALREIIANALDEQALTNTREVNIARDSNGTWHVRDYGRGLKYEHLTQNENKEKLRQADKVVGKFGVGLKDALATLHRHKVDVTISSKHGEVALTIVPKHGFADVETLHAVISRPQDAAFVGTDFAFRNVQDSDVSAAKNFFLRFSRDKILDSTNYGQVLRRDDVGKARIYVKGLLVAEEDDFAFSYNITSLTAAMNRALNRERTNVGRSAYSDRVKAMLLASTAPEVAETLADDLQRMELGTSRDEVKWTDVAVHACQILNAANKIIFVTATQRTAASDAIDHAISDGYKAVTVPENIKERLRGIKDIKGNAVRELDVYREEFARSFEFSFVDRSKLSAKEREVFDLHGAVAKLVGGLPQQVKQIKISETMRPEFVSACDALGLWEPANRWIIIKRSELRSVEAFAGTLLHEIT
ncbi:MAG TPA: ATP-binding protein, partial [Nitrospira sp.]|nr:ATP-binding protein [Nitrospira sp.]